MVELLEEHLALGRLMRSSKKEIEVNSALDILKYIASVSPEAFPNIVIVLQHFITIAVSVATAERSLSKLKLLTTYLRASMGQERLLSLATLSIEHDLSCKLDYNDIINSFAGMKVEK